MVRGNGTGLRWSFGGGRGSENIAVECLGSAMNDVLDVNFVSCF